MDVLVPLLVAISIGVPVLIASTRGLSRDARQRVLRILLWAFALRVSLATLFAVIPSLRVFHEDAEAAEYYAARIARYWSGERILNRDWISGASRNVGVNYLFASMLYVFGPYPLTISIVNSLLGSLSSLLLYRIGRRLFHEVIARRAMLFTAFFPSMIIWSSMALKDVVVGFVILFTTLFCIRLRQRFSVVNVIGVLAPIFCVYPIRFYLVYFLFGSVIGTMVVNRSGRFFSGLSKQLLLVAALVVIVGGVGLSSNAREDLDVFDLAKVSSYRRGMAISANSSFSADADVSTPAKAIAFLPIGVTALLWSPFPWQMTSLRPLLTLPEMLLWWSCIPALIRGILFAVRKRFSEVSPIVIFSVTLLVGYSLAMGNVGAAFRMRAQILNLLFLFASLGHYLQLVHRNRLSEDSLWAEPAANESRR